MFGQSTTASWYACSHIKISDQNTTMIFWTEQFGQKQMNLTSGLRYQLDFLRFGNICTAFLPFALSNCIELKKVEITLIPVLGRTGITILNREKSIWHWWYPLKTVQLHRNWIGSPFVTFHKPMENYSIIKMFCYSISFSM